MSMDIKQIAADLNQNLPFGVSVRAHVPNNYLGCPDAANAYLVLTVNDVCDPSTHKFRSQKEQYAVCAQVRNAISARLPVFTTKPRAIYFGHTTQYRDGVSQQLHIRLCAALKGV